MRFGLDSVKLEVLQWDSSKRRKRKTSKYMTIGNRGLKRKADGQKSMEKKIQRDINRKES